MTRLQVDEPFSTRLYHRLQLGMHLKLFDHVADMPLDGVRCNPEVGGHRCSAQPFRQQAQNLELAWSELRAELLMFRRLDVHPVLVGDGFGEQGDTGAGAPATRDR